MLTNSRTVLTALGVGGDARTMAYLLIAVGWVAALGLALRARAAAATSPQPATEAA
jgi:hypothetical protein